jgi:hypothetical protein
VGKMKLEKLIDECVFLKPKTYALLEESESKSFNKGVILKQNINVLKFENYKKVLFDNDITRCKNTIIQKTCKFGGLGVSMNTLEVEKIGLDAWYDKRIMVNSIETQPYGMKATESKTPLPQRIKNNLINRATSFGLDIDLGCSIEELMKHLENKFKIGMCWKNYGDKWELDHIIPVSYVNHEEFKQLTQKKARQSEETNMSLQKHPTTI